MYHARAADSLLLVVFLREEQPLQRLLDLLEASFTSGTVQVALGILQRIGFQDIVCAADGAAALAEISARGGGDSFDIVLTDLHMPRKVRQGMRRAGSFVP